MCHMRSLTIINGKAVSPAAYQSVALPHCSDNIEAEIIGLFVSG